MTLYVHRAQSTRLLADGLAELLSSPLEDPFAEEVVAVPAKGVERWLAQQLSHRLGVVAEGHDDGVCAGVRFLNPHSLVSLVLGIERDDPWHPEQLTWPVLRAIDAGLHEPWAAVLARHLGRRPDGPTDEILRGRRYAVAHRLARLFADYAAQRPAILADWRRGGSGDGLGGQLAEDLAWQPELWRRVLEGVDAEPPEVRHDRVVEEIRDGSVPSLGPDAALPGRLSLFGHTRIARSEVEVLQAIGRHRDVHLWLPQASPAAWEALAEVTSVGPVPRAQDRSADLVHHPLLASLGRDARELQRTLAGTEALDRPTGRLLTAGGEAGDRGCHAGDRTEHAVDRAGPAGATAGPSLLRLLQQDIAADHLPTDSERRTREIAAADRSVQVHACHGQSRQIDVLRDVLVGLLEQDPTLEPRDILVMCPDVDAYAPLVHAGFGLAEVVRDRTRARQGAGAHPAHELRVRIADRAPLQTNPLLALAVRLLELAGARSTAGELLDLARNPVVRRRFGLDDDSLERLADWVDAVGVRWGLDVEHRAAYQLPHLAQNTWAAGLDRILVGAALDGEEMDRLGAVLALDDLDSGDLDLAGRLAELLERLKDTLRRLREAEATPDWTAALVDGVTRLASVPRQDAWQETQLRSVLERVRDAVGNEGGLTLSLSDVHALLRERAGGRPTRSSFRTGSLTVCTMVPMRSVPHRVVALVGMDDGVFPRSTTPDGDDALARCPVTGERDLRTEDRQLLLDAIMSAGETLVLTYTGFDEHTGAERPPAVPLGELLDALRSTASGPGVQRLVTHHPLQVFDPRNLGATPGDQTPLLPEDGPFTFDPAALGAGRARTGPLTEPVTIAAQPLGRAVVGDVALADLVRFFDNPARAFLRSRLGMILPEVPELPSEGIPVELDGLSRWAIGERMLQQVLAGGDTSSILEAERARGDLPPDALGTQALDELCRMVQGMAEGVWRTTGQGGWGVPLERGSLDVDLELPGGRHLTGTVPDLLGEDHLTVTTSSLKAKHRMRAWILTLAMAAAGHPGRGHVIAQQYKSRREGKLPGHAAYGAPSQERALELLAELVDVRDRGLAEVLPLPVGASLTWARKYLETGREGSARQAAARADWVTSEGGFPAEQDDPSWTRVLGEQAPFDALDAGRREDEAWHPGVESRLGQLALRVWGPMIEHEWNGWA